METRRRMLTLRTNEPRASTPVLETVTPRPMKLFASGSCGRRAGGGRRRVGRSEHALDLRARQIAMALFDEVSAERLLDRGAMRFEIDWLTERVDRAFRLREPQLDDVIANLSAAIGLARCTPADNHAD